MNLTHLRKLATDAKELIEQCKRMHMISISSSSHLDLAEALDRALSALEHSQKQTKYWFHKWATDLGKNLDHNVTFETDQQELAKILEGE